jgi:imidazolonepropionase-like amidohydrolase
MFTKKILSFLFVFAALQTLAQDSSRYTIYYNTRKAGFIHINRMADGLKTIRYMYNDRGRGPDYQFRIQTNKQGAFTLFELKGIGYMKDSTKSLAFGDGKLFKRVQGKDTSASINFKTLNLFGYVPNGLFEFFYPVATDTALHGDVNYSFKKLTEYTTVLKGKKLKAELWSYGAKGTEYPELVWLYPNHRLLGQFSTWSSVIETGKESLIPQLRKINDSLYYQNLETNSAKIFQKAIDRFALFNCNVVDVVNGKLIPNQTILVSNGTIEAVGDTASVIIPETYKRINASNKTVMPGMWDMHAHQFPGEGPRNLMNGITSVRDLGNSLDVEIQKTKTEQGKIVGPRVAWMCGFIDFNDDMAGPCGVLINNIEEGKAAIRNYYAKGYKSIKLYSSIKADYIKPLAEEAHRLGMRVHGHVPAFVTAEQAIKNGYDEINHLNMMILGYFGNEIDTRTRVRLTIMKERAYEVSPAGTYGQNLLALMKEKNTVLDPTSVVWIPFAAKANMNRKDSVEKACSDTLIAWLTALYKNGTRLMPGTDAGGSNGYTNELKNYVTAGIPAAEVVRMATVYPAQYCGWGEQLGTVTAGKIADLIIVSGNPLERISVLDNVQIVVSNGKLFYPKDLKVPNANNGAMMLHAH